MLRPHDGVHRQFGAGWPASQQLADSLVLIFFEPEGCPRLLGVRSFTGILHGVDHVLRLAERATLLTR